MNCHGSALHGSSSPRTGAADAERDEAASPCSKYLREIPWSSWQSTHPDEHLRSRQRTSWVEFTKRDPVERASITGLTQGILRLDPHGLLPVHHHPAPYTETYYFTRGNGVVKIGRVPLGLAEKARLPADAAQAVEGTLQTVAIEPGLHVDIPAATLHGIEAGPDGCEFIWTFAAARWADIPYIYLDENLPNRNAKAVQEPPGMRATGVHVAESAQCKMPEATETRAHTAAVVR